MTWLQPRYLLWGPVPYWSWANPRPDFLLPFLFLLLFLFVAFLSLFVPLFVPLFVIFFVPFFVAFFVAPLAPCLPACQPLPAAVPRPPRTMEGPTHRWPRVVLVALLLHIRHELRFFPTVCLHLT